MAIHVHGPTHMERVLEGVRRGILTRRRTTRRTPGLRSVVESWSGLAIVPGFVDNGHDVLAVQISALNLLVEVGNVGLMVLAPVCLQRLLHTTSSNYKLRTA